EGGGFAPATRTRVKVDVGAETRVNLRLAPQATESAVDVRAETSLPRPDSGALGEVVNNKQVDALPINGRDYRRLTTLAPGAAPRSPRGSLATFTGNGQREKANLFPLDGSDNNHSSRNQPPINQAGGPGAPATPCPVAALSEFSIQTQGAGE